MSTVELDACPIFSGFFCSNTPRVPQLAECMGGVPVLAFFCLLSALVFHGLTTQNPHELWVAIPSNAWRPELDYPLHQHVWGIPGEFVEMLLP